MDAVLRAVAADLADRYEIERELGRGGMATVYLARDVRHDRRVAVKVMRPDVSASVSTERFLREVRIAARLNHPNVLALHDSGRVPIAPTGEGDDQGVLGEVLYYVMPYVDGESLRDRLRRDGQLAIGDALRIAAEVADALSFAHAQGVVHRDIKPENILLAGSRPGSSAHWHALVADFGIARVLAESDAGLTATGVSVGTPAYMSPEQAAGNRAVDARSDVYSLGCVLYEMLVGEPPFTGPNASAVIARHLTAPTPSIRTVRPSVPAELDALVRGSLEKVPADRTPDAETFRSAVDGVRGSLASREPRRGMVPSLPGAGSQGTMPNAAPDWRRRLWTLVASGGVLAALGLAFAMMMARSAGTASPPGESPTVHVLDRSRVAVIPLRNLGDSVTAYLADASTDELISALSRVGRVRVLARSSVQAVLEKGSSGAEAGRAISAGSIVEGTLRKLGDSVAYDVKLVDANSGDQIWSASYARHARDLPGIQDSVARTIADQVGTVDPASVRSASAPPRVSGAAYDAYLRGVYMARRARQTQPAVAVEDSAIRYFEQAVALDPGFALPRAAMASLYTNRFFNFDPNPALEERAFLEVEKALALDPTLAEAYQARGELVWTRSNGFPHEAAATLHRKAVALKPSLVDPHESLGSIYMHVGLFDRALAEYATAISLDPTTTFVPGRIARIHWYQGRYEQALREFEATPARLGSFSAERALVMNYLGRSDEALAWLHDLTGSVVDARSSDIMAARAVIHAGRGERARSLEAIALAVQYGSEASHFHHAAYSIAQAYALLGDRDKALEYLRRTATDGMPCYPLFRDDPHLRSLAADPRFVQLMSELRRRFEHLSKTLE